VKIDGGRIDTAIKALAGVPLFMYDTSRIYDLAATFTLLATAEKANYILSLSTGASPSNLK
jgi:hypothetical protein